MKSLSAVFALVADMLEKFRDMRVAELGETYDDMAFVFSNRALAHMDLNDCAAAEPMFGKDLRAAEPHKHCLHGPTNLASAPWFHRINALSPLPHTPV